MNVNTLGRDSSRSFFVIDSHDRAGLIESKPTRRRDSRLFGLFLMLMIVVEWASAAAPQLAAGRSGTVPIVATPQGGATILFDQFEFPSNNGLPDQDFESDLDAFDSMAADDFTVPDEAAWLVSEVRTIGTTSLAGGASVSVNFHLNAVGGGNANLPGALITECTYANIQPTDVAGSFAIALPTPCLLRGGTYWVSIQTRQNAMTFGQHFWSVRREQSGSESVWKNPGDGFATGCTQFRPKTSCGGVGGTGPDLLFQIWGMSAGADLEFTLEEAQGSAVAGQTKTYLAIAANAGPAAARDVMISFIPPPLTTVISATPNSNGSCSHPGATGAGTIDCLWPGTTLIGAERARRLEVALRISPSAEAGGALEVSGSVRSATSDPNTGNNTSAISTVVSAIADLAISLVASPNPVIAGDFLVYSTNATNAGPSDARGLIVRISLPSSVSMISATPSAAGQCIGTTLVECIWPGATSPDVSRSAVIVTKVSHAAIAAEAIIARGSVNSTTPDPVTGNSSASVTSSIVTRSDLALSLRATPAEIEIGDSFEIVAESINQGLSDAQDVQIDLRIEPDLRYLGHIASLGASCATPQSGTAGLISCRWQGATVPASARTLHVHGFGGSAGSSAVAASTNSVTFDPVSTNDIARTSVLVGRLIAEIPALGNFALMLLGSLFVGLAAVGLIAIRRST